MSITPSTNKDTNSYGFENNVSIMDTSAFHCATNGTASAPIVVQQKVFEEIWFLSLVYADKPQTLDHLEDNIRRVIADIRPQMLEKVIELDVRLDYIQANRGSPMPEIIFKM
ncbi:hypothetical protein TNCV_299821 [Trichonephila clavipes]|nr:hypothetical protein TNCV_299821 [Trichonephila clavipes]